MNFFLLLHFVQMTTRELAFKIEINLPEFALVSQFGLTARVTTLSHGVAGKFIIKY